MPRNIRNTRRNFARPSDTFTATTSYSSITFANGSATAGISITKTTNPIGPSGNGTFRVTSSPAAITGTTTNTTATTVTCAFNIPSTAAQTSTIFITEDNYNGAGKPVTAPNTFNAGTIFAANALVIGGGGAGGGGFGQTSSGNYGTGAGGGAGAYREFTDYILTTGVNFAITIGAGGSGGVNQSGSQGSESTFHTITAGGGGGGGRGDGRNVGYNGQSGSGGASGGGGGGSSRTDQGNQTHTAGSYSAPTFYTGKDLYTISGGNGRDGTTLSNGNGFAGGGGGATGAATSATGFAGRASTITGSSVTRGGGGGGGSSSGGAGGGGGGGSDTAGTAGTANTGGGGGGCYRSGDTGIAGGNGGSGVVILRYPDTRTITIGAGLTGSTATDGSFRVTTITAGSGNVSFA